MKIKATATNTLLSCALGLVGLVSMNIHAQTNNNGEGNSTDQNQHNQHRRGPKQYHISGLDGASISLWKPNLDQRQLIPKMGTITIPPTGVDNFHALVISKDWGTEIESIIRYEYMRGKPSGESPTKILTAEKVPLEIVPEPLPREHLKYSSNTEWSFITRYRGKQLTNQPVIFTTEHGSRFEAHSDEQGVVTFTLPDDFPNIKEGERSRTKAQFEISTVFKDGVVNHVTTLTADYYLPASHWQSKPWGIAVAGLGFAFGGFIGWRNKPNEKRKQK